MVIYLCLEKNELFMIFTKTWNLCVRECFVYAMETLHAKQKMWGGYMAQRLDKDV